MGSEFNIRKALFSTLTRFFLLVPGMVTDRRSYSSHRGEQRFESSFEPESDHLQSFLSCEDGQISFSSLLVQPTLSQS